MIVVVSPHLDDAVLSCGGLLAMAAERGEPTCVITVFSSGAEGERRRAEDQEALAILGAEAVHVGLLDAPERLGLARTHGALVEQAVVAPDDVAAVVAALSPALERMYGARIVVPLGVGGHVDHLVVHEAFASTARHAELYEDRPYALVPGAVRARLLELGLESPEPAPTPEALHAAFDALPHLRAFLPEAPADRARSLDWLEARIFGASTVRMKCRRKPSLIEHPVSPAAAERARRARQAYASQPSLLPRNVPVERTFG